MNLLTICRKEHLPLPKITRQIHLSKQIPQGLKTTTKEGKRKYQRLYMQKYRQGFGMIPVYAKPMIPIRLKTTSLAGKTEYQKLYMRQYRNRKRQLKNDF